MQGLADTFIQLRLPFTSDEAKKLNQEIFETLYFAAVTASMEEAKADGPYSTFKGSPISKGEFQYNLWGIKDEELSGRWDWDKLRKQIKKIWSAQLIAGSTYAYGIYLTDLRK